MCGIAGWIAPRSSAPDEPVLARMLQAIAHRGPDGEGMLFAEVASRTLSARHQVALGHRRLAIIDPNGARQPMSDERAGVTLVFNGEIYNFRELRAVLVKHGYHFKLDSDTEVLLHAYQHWGVDVVRHLRGMFAFALWDGPRERLVLARDRFGEKPLFLHENAQGMYFASEIKALLELPHIDAGVDLASVWDYLSYRYVPGPKTLFRGIRKLPPATVLLWESGRRSERRYWTPPDREAGPAAHAKSPEIVVTDFLAALDESVRMQMVSDVPFGAFLSGGLDSSSIVGLMSRHNSNVKTFSVGFSDSGYSELPYAAEVADHFGTRHQEIVIEPGDIMDKLPMLVGFRDAPVSEPSDIPIYIMACEAARSVKMVLTGEGSDEVLAGYPKHVFERFTGGYQLIPGALRRRLIGPLVQALPYGFRRVKTAVANLNIDNWQERYVRWFGALDRAGRERLSTLNLNGYAYLAEPPFDADPRASTLRRILYFDQMSWLPDNLLERGDRMTMAASIESRVPFLDHKLAEFASRLPDNLRVRGMKTKWILRQAARRLLPKRILARPKVGFRVPVNEWFRTGLRDYLREHLQSAQSITRRYYDGAALDGILAEHQDGRQNHEKLLWTLLNLEIWHRQR